MTRLPTGTVVFFMTDVEGSTRQWREDSDAMGEALSCLDDQVHVIVDRHGGVVIEARGEGDSHFAVFDRATAALRAAVDLQRSRATITRPRVRVAIHAGEAECRAGNYFGTTVNAAARIRSAAHGGQILTSRVIADLAVAADGVKWRALGAHRLRDLGSPVELYQVDADGIPAEFPPPVSLNTTTTPVMFIVFVDQHHGSQRMPTEGLARWAKPLFKAFRTAADCYDGRFLKLVGDGCFAAFDDPRHAVAFARDLCEQPELNLRAAVAAGLVEIIEGELIGRPVMQAAAKVGRVEPGTYWIAPVVAELLAAVDHLA
jgi:class 3 adenylate cyclase